MLNVAPSKLRQAFAGHPGRKSSLLAVVAVLAVASSCIGQESAANEPAGKAEADEQAVRELSIALANAFNDGKADAIAQLFHPEAELIDDAGTVHKGNDAIGAIFEQFFSVFPQAKMKLEVEKLRFAGSGLAIEDGTRSVMAQDGQSRAKTRYTLVHVKRDGNWRIASARETEAETEMTHHDRLEPLAWLVGDWVDEGADAAISIACRWSDDENFLLLDFHAKVNGETMMKSRQRIGWDPLTRSVRSWVFDSDGGYGHGQWTRIDRNWVIKSTAVLPEGLTGSATIFVEPVDEDRFLMKGFDRVVGGSLEDDYEATIVRKPPTPSK